MPPSPAWLCLLLTALMVLVAQPAFAQENGPVVPDVWSVDSEASRIYLVGYAEGHADAVRDSADGQFVLITICCYESFDEEARLLRERHGVELRGFGSDDVQPYEDGYRGGYDSVMRPRVESRVARDTLQALRTEARITAHSEILNERDRSTLAELMGSPLEQVLDRLQPLDWGEPVSAVTAGAAEEMEFHRDRYGDLATHTRLVIRLQEGRLAEFELNASP